MGNPLVESSDSYLVGLIHASCSQAEDSESRVAVMTPSSQKSPTPRISTPGLTRAALGSPAPQASQNTLCSPVPCPAFVSPSLSSVSPPRKQHPQDQVLTPETPGLGDHIPGTQPRPSSQSQRVRQSRTLPHICISLSFLCLSSQETTPPGSGPNPGDPRARGPYPHPHSRSSPLPPSALSLSQFLSPMPRLFSCRKVFGLELCRRL